jgi:hypothetical protein
MAAPKYAGYKWEIPQRVTASLPALNSIMKTFQALVEELQKVSGQVSPLQEGVDVESNPFHQTLTTHGYKHSGSMKSVDMAQHTYKRKGSRPVTVKFSGGTHSWEHKKERGFGPTRLNNTLHAHYGTGDLETGEGF